MYQLNHQLKWASTDISGPARTVDNLEKQKQSFFQQLWLQNIHKIFMHEHKGSKFSLFQAFNEESKLSSCFHHVFSECDAPSLHEIKCDVSFCSLSEKRTQTSSKQTATQPVCLPRSPRAEKWECFRSDGGVKMIVFSDVLWPRHSPRWRWQRHSGIGCGRAWQASKASALFLPGRPGTASQPATLQQPPN